MWYKTEKKGRLYNYIIDELGIVWEMFPPDKAGTVALFDTYSDTANSIFSGSYCPIKRTDSTLDLNTAVLSVCTLSSYVTNGIDTGDMSVDCKKSLTELLTYLICRNNKSSTNTLTDHSVVLRSTLPRNKSLRDEIGHTLFKNNEVQFLALKCKVLHATISSERTFGQLFSYIDKELAKWTM
jgi:hypothetical protein